MKQKLNNINNINIISSVLVIVVIVIILIKGYSLYIRVYKTDTFYNLAPPNPTNPTITNISLTTKPTPIDRTKLYGALFLENIDKTIKNLSNPDIQYEENRIQLNNYSDILL